MPLEVKINGLRELDAAFQKFAADASEKLLAQGVSAGAKVIQDAIAARAPVRQEGGQKKAAKGSSRGPGWLRRHIRRKRVNKGSGTMISYSIGPSAAAFYARFVEFGHGPAKKRRAATTREVELGTRSTPAHPFIRPALGSAKSSSVNALVENMRARLARFVRDCK